MSESGQSTSNQAEGVPLSAVTIAPALSHCIYVLIGFAWPAFGILFLILMCSSAWFEIGFSIVWLFPVICFVALGIGHSVALALESRWMTDRLYFFKRGMPALFYRRFATVQTAAKGEDTTALNRGLPAIVFGDKRILLSTVDELFLTFLGVLELRSYSTAGKVTKASAEGGDAPLNRADVLARVPIGVLPLPDQKRVIEIFRAARPGLIVNKRLEDRLQSPIVKGQAGIQAMGAVVLLYALFDVSYATFTWLEMLKDYYGSQLCMRQPDKAEFFLKGAKDHKAVAQELLNRAEEIRLHPCALSWAYRALFNNGNSKAELLAIKAETLYWLDERDQAVKVLEEALVQKPAGYKVQLQMARLLSRAGKRDEARAILDKVLEKHKDVLLPRLYNYAMVANDEKVADELYKKYLAELDEEVFGEEPGWPPIGEKPLIETLRRSDLEFLVELLKPANRK